MRSLRRVLIGIGLGLAACTARITPVSPMNATPTLGPVAQPTSTHIPVDLSPAQRAAIANVAQSLGLPAAQVELVSTEAVIWPDGCMGIRRIGVMCAMNQVPGFRIVLSVGDKEYEVHTNQDGSIVVPAQAMQTPGPAQQAAIKQLATNVGVPDSNVRLVDSTLVEWPDSCLGVAQEGVQRFVVLDGKPGARYEAVYKGTLTFSPDSKRLAYFAGKGGMRTVVLDGAEGAPHRDAMVSTLRFSPDGTKLAYAAQLESGKWAVVVNGQAGTAFDYIGSFTGVNWSPDSRRLAYAGLVDKQWGAVVDDAGFPYDAIASMVFSPDSRRAAFHAQTDGKWVLVVNAPDGTYSSRLKSDSVLNETLIFTPDGKYLLYGAMTNGRPHMVVNGQPARSFYEAIWNIDGGRLVIDTPTSFSYIAMKDGKIYLVREAVVAAR